MVNKVKEIRELIDKLNKYTKAYDEGHSLISDKEWDDSYFLLQTKEREYGIIYPDSPTQVIHFETKSKLDKVIHDQPPMLSLDKTKDINVISSFVKGHDWFGMFKMDGLSCRLIYEDGKLIQASTRGNGIEGEDITHNVLVMSNVPKSIPNLELTIVDGEIICDLDTFNKKFSKNYANPRNFASGSIRQLSNKESASRCLSFVAWDLIKGCDDIDFNFWRLEKLDDWGFDTVPRVGDAETIEDAITILDGMRNEYPYSICPIDGYVFKFESVKYGKSLGKTDHHFKNAIAFKFYNEEYKTKLLDIEWSMGRTGQLTPVAIYKPIDIDGSECSRASLHNLSVMNDTLGLYPYKGQSITIYKANEIIPQVGSADKNEDNIDWDNLIKLTSCPICGGELEVQNNNGVVTVWCGNPSCGGKLLNRVDHFLGIKGLNVKGISKATIGKLIDWGWINGLADIFRLEQHKTEWILKEGFGAASVGKILSAIASAKVSTSLESFISAIGIPLVGRTVSKEIVKYYDTWEDFRNAVGGDWTEFEGFGYEMSKAINSFNYSEADATAAMLVFQQPEVQTNAVQAAAIQGKAFCVTGKTKIFKNRAELQADIEKSGGRLVSSVTSKTDYLITNTPESGTAKNISAKKLGIPVITEEEYLNLKS